MKAAIASLKEEVECEEVNKGEDVGETYEVWFRCAVPLLWQDVVGIASAMPTTSRQRNAKVVEYFENQTYSTASLINPVSHLRMTHMY